MATSLLVTETSKEDSISLEQVSYIYYLLCFQKDIVSIKALINLDSKVNTITPPYALKLGLQVYYKNIGTQKIDGSTFKTFEIVLASFQIEDKIGRAWFFQETFLLANIGVEMVLDMFFLIFSNANV